MEAAPPSGEVEPSLKPRGLSPNAGRCGEDGGRMRNAGSPLTPQGSETRRAQHPATQRSGLKEDRLSKEREDTHARTRRRAHTHAHTCTHAHTRTHAHMHAHTRAHARTHTARTHLCTHTHADGDRTGRGHLGLFPLFADSNSFLPRERPTPNTQPRSQRGGGHRRDRPDRSSIPGQTRL